MAAREQLSSTQRMVVFFLIVAVIVFYDVWAVSTGVIGTYDDEPWQRAAVIGAAFLLVFRPEAFDRLLNVFTRKKE